MDENTPMWKLWGDKESPIQTMKRLSDEFGYSLNLCKLLYEDNRPTTGDELVRAIRFGLVHVPAEREAEAELKRRKNKLAADRRKATIDRRAREAAKVVPLRPSV